jgi:hypothetical protein
MSRRNKNVLPFAIVPIRINGNTVARVVYCGLTENEEETLLQIHCSEESEPLILAIKRSYARRYKTLYNYGKTNQRVIVFEIRIGYKVNNPLPFVRKFARWTADAAEDIADAIETVQTVNKQMVEDGHNEN